MEGGIELMESLVSGAMGRRIRIATSTANPTEICLAWPAGVTLSCTHESSLNKRPAALHISTKAGLRKQHYIKQAEIGDSSHNTSPF